jgi:hypothetical protein
MIANATPVLGISDVDFNKLFNEGQNAVISRDYKTGIPLLLKARDLKPKDPDVNFWLWNAYSKTDTKAAIPFAKKVIALMPGTRQAERASTFIKSTVPPPPKAPSQFQKLLLQINSTPGSTQRLGDFITFQCEQTVEIGQSSTQKQSGSAEQSVIILFRSTESGQASIAYFDEKAWFSFKNLLNKTLEIAKTLPNGRSLETGTVDIDGQEPMRLTAVGKSKEELYGQSPLIIAAQAYLSIPNSHGGSVITSYNSLPDCPKMWALFKKLP